MIRRFEAGLMSGKLEFSNAKGSYRPKSMTPKSVRRKLSSLRTFFRYQMREGIIADNPTEIVVAPKIGKKLPVFVPDYKMDELLEAKEAKKEDFPVFRDLMILMMAYYTGMRRSELVALKVEDVDLNVGVIRITGKGDKQRIVPMLSELIDEVRLYLEVREDALKGKQHTSFLLMSAPLLMRSIFTGM